MEKEQLMNIEIGKISPSPRNPRKTFNEEELNELAQSIQQKGLLQPITVRPVGKTYEIVCGERRYRAVKKNAEASKAKKATIACIVVKMTDEEAFEAMITENLQRKEVDPMEEAFAFCELVKAGKTVDEIAEKFGKNKRFIQERIKLNSLIDPLKEFLTKGIIPIGGAMLLSKLKEELQVSYFENIKDRDYDGSIIGVMEIRRWIEREFMRLDNAQFLEEDEDDEEALPTEDWNKGQFEKCVDCCMNTGNAGCLFYQMKGAHYCTDRDCFEKKTAAFYFSEIEKLGEGRIAMEGQKLEQGLVVIIDDDPEAKQGYDSTKRIRKMLLDMIREKGYMIKPSSTYDSGRCKYYGDDERIPKLLEQGKVVKCIDLGSPYYIRVDDVYYYTPSGKGSEEPEQSPEEAEAQELATKYEREKERMLDKLDNELRDWSVDTFGKDYAKRTDETSEEEEKLFWAVILKDCSSDLTREIGSSVILRDEDVFPYVKKNYSEENKRRWMRDFLNETCRRQSSYNGVSRGALRRLFKLAYPDDYKKLFDKLSEAFEKRTAKTKERLKELGYGANGKKL